MATTDQQACLQCARAITEHTAHKTPDGRVMVYCRGGRHSHTWSQADLRHLASWGLLASA